MHRAPLLVPSALALSLTLWAAAASAANFQITPISLPSGTKITGTIQTDGSTGPLSAANFTAWSITVRSTEALLYNPSQPGAPELTGVAVSADGRRLLVRRSPDGVADGGTLRFGSVWPLERYVTVATYAGYTAASGGQSSYVNGAQFEWQWFGDPSGGSHQVATAAAGSAVFRLIPVVYPSGTTLTGTITTDGGTGVISAANITDYRLKVQTVSEVTYLRTATSGNSSVLPNTNGVSSDGTQLLVARPGGYLGFGVPPAGSRRGEGRCWPTLAPQRPAEAKPVTSTPSPWSTSP
ncbi:hypothetical protein [Ideonella paludis]|uniref:hypothetical protein n=1 Tax=Ideonella paludis TaxID=1233411 RepID=UPI0036364D40